MELFNNKRNHHYISQAEQRQNCLNPNALKKKNQKIYSFKIVDRECYALNLIGPISIENTLSFIDLFCFDDAEKVKGQFNFEELFQRYEDDIQEQSNALINKVKLKCGDVSKDLIDVFITKFINFARNPYSIKKILSTFPSILDVHPTDPVIYKIYKKVLKGRKPKQKFLAEKLGINDQEYEQWLRIIFMLLVPTGKSEHYNFIESLITNMYLNPLKKVEVMLFTYDKASCLLSDRGYNYYRLDNTHDTWEFNLNRNAFIRFGFTGIEKLVGRNLTSEELEFMETIKSDVSMYHRHNDMNQLTSYNKTTIYQAATNVFSSSKIVWGL